MAAQATKVEGSIVAGTNCEEILKKYYGITAVSMTRQKGFADITYVVKATDGNKYIFKVLVNADSKNERALAEIKLMEFVREQGVNVPQTLPTLDGNLLGEEDFEDETRGRHRKAFRVIQFIEGRTIWMPDDADQLTPELWHNIGVIAAQTDAALDKVTFIDVAKFAQLPVYPLGINADVPDVIEAMSTKMPELTEEQRKWCRDWKATLFEPHVIAKEDQLHKQIIHCDMHTGNFILSNEHPAEVKAIFDFGNVIYTLRLLDVCGALLGVVMHSNEIIPSMKAFLEGYEKHVQLSQVEKEALFPVLVSRAVHVILYHTYCKVSVPSYNADYIGSIIGNRLWPMIERFMSRQSEEERFLTSYAARK